MQARLMCSAGVQVAEDLLERLKKVSEEVCPRAELATMEKHLQNLEEAGPTEGETREARVRTLRAPSKGLLHYALSSLIEPTDAWKTERCFGRAWKALKFELRPGIASASKAVKVLQSDIDSVKDELGIQGSHHKD